MHREPVHPPSSVNNTSDAHQSSVVSRRTLMRAGLSAGAVAATLKSNTVLATGYTGGCVRPSSYASVLANTKLSNYKNGQQGCSCPKPEYWRDYHRSECENRKLSECGLRNGIRTKCSEPRSDGTYWDHSFYSVLSGGNDGDRELAKYVIACYMAALKYDKAPLSVDQCRQIWGGNGVWTPAGQRDEWTRAYTLQYLKHICA